MTKRCDRFPIPRSALHFNPIRVTSIEIQIEDRGSLILRRNRDGSWLNTASGGVHQIPSEVSDRLLQLLSQLKCTHIAIGPDTGHQPVAEPIRSVEITVKSRDSSRIQTITIGQQVDDQFRILRNRALVGRSAFVVSAGDCEEMIRLISPFLHAVGTDEHR